MKLGFYPSFLLYNVKKMDSISLTRVMDIVLVFIDSELWHKKLKQQNLLSLFGDKKINQSRNK